MKRGIIVNKNDNVATVLDDVLSGEVVSCKGGTDTVEIRASEAVGRGHKIAIADIKAGADVYKYGFPIGYALVDIAVGSHVHVHNVGSKRTEE